MAYLNYVVLALLLFFLMRRFLPIKGVNTITTNELKKEINNKNKQFVDVRTNGEFKGNHIKGFKNIPLNQLAQVAEKDLSKEKEVIVICQSGVRSQRASKVLKSLGFKNITNIKGGMNAWF